MQHAVLNQDVGVDDARGVDKDCAVRADGDFEFFAVEGGEFGVVAERGAVAYCALDDVVLQDRGELFVGDVATGGSEALEGIVVGAEDSYVGSGFEGGDEVGLGGGAGEGGEVA